MSGARDKLREREIEKLDMKFKDIEEECQTAAASITEVTGQLQNNKIERENEKADEDYKAGLEEKALLEKMAMDDAARFVQNKWNWFQTVGKALMKGKKRKGKGKGKKKKK
jgi:TRAP-type C4-dicarboxylate transport system substrate-binding protein